ncbi:DUF6401 family natural product biosynthesis protein [Prauserella alba]|uniref:Uncharacterized protein n=1 Tax=Prauserella alba TaxID=176898 RepID=A0ABN1V3G3_9PSEU|nr:DUF6401 family natural product biosynthesis protein [Prauserella alba]MCP2180416.1 hypothetical protein [Prauserella alba]
MGWLMNTWRESAARRELTALTDRLGRIGAAPSLLPVGRLAAVDQHAAAIRDILTLGAGGLSQAQLAYYARGVHDAARDSGWTPPADEGATADWVTLRLAAVCLLATAGAAAGADLDPALFF